MNNKDKNPKVLKIKSFAVRSDIVTDVSWANGYIVVTREGSSEALYACSEMEAIAFVNEWEEWLGE